MNALDFRGALGRFARRAPRQNPGRGCQFSTGLGNLRPVSSDDKGEKRSSTSQAWPGQQDRRAKRYGTTLAGENGRQGLDLPDAFEFVSRTSSCSVRGRRTQAGTGAAVVGKPRLRLTLTNARPDMFSHRSTRRISLFPTGKRSCASSADTRYPLRKRLSSVSESGHRAVSHRATTYCPARLRLRTTRLLGTGGL